MCTENKPMSRCCSSSRNKSLMICAVFVFTICCLLPKSEAASMSSWDHLYKCRGTIKERCHYLAMFCRSSILGRPAKRSDPSLESDQQDYMMENMQDPNDYQGLIYDDADDDLIDGADDQGDYYYGRRQRRSLQREKRFTLTCKHCAVYCWR